MRAGVPLPAMSSADRIVYTPDGTVIGAWRTGNGPPIVLVHGTADDHTAWDLVAPRLAMRFEVYAVDRRGRGASPWSGPVYAIEQEFDDIAAVVDSTGTPTWLVGHGYGADIAIGAALRTRNLAGLVLYEPAPGIPTVDEPTLRRGRAAHRRRGSRWRPDAHALRRPRARRRGRRRACEPAPGWATTLAMVETMPRELRAEQHWRPGGLRRPRPADAPPARAARARSGRDAGRRWPSRPSPTAASRSSRATATWRCSTAPELVAQAIIDFVFDPSRS